MNWTQAWAEYIHGDVVSKHAARITQIFLVNSLSGSDNIHSTDDDDVDDSDADADIPPLTFTKEGAQALLNRELNRQLKAETQTIRKSSYRDHVPGLLAMPKSDALA